MAVKRTVDAIIMGGGGSKRGVAGLFGAAAGETATTRRHNRHCDGVLHRHRTPMQRVAGVDDSLEDRVEDAGRFAPDSIEARNNAALRRWFLSHYAETLDHLAWAKTGWADKSFGVTDCTSAGPSPVAVWWGKLWPE